MPITSVSPTTIHSRGTRALTVTGTNLLNLLSVSVQGDDADVLNLISATEAVATWHGPDWTPASGVAVWWNITGEGVSNLAAALNIVDVPCVLAAEDRQIASRMLAVSPSTNVAAAAWKMGDTLPAGDDIASAVVACGPNFSGTLSLDLVSPASSTGTSSVKMFRRYRDQAGNALSQADSAAISVVTGTPVTAVLPLSLAPAGTASCELGLYSNMTPPGDPTRFNEFLDPRCTVLGNWSARLGWTLTAVSGLGVGVAGVTTGVRVEAVAAGAVANAGFDLYSPTSAVSPPAVGAPAIPGATMTLSCYMWCTKAGTAVMDVRPFAGAAWSAAVTVGTGVAIAAATYTKVSVTIVVPAGATQLAATCRISSSPTYAIGDRIIVTAVMLEEAATAGLYFDGSGQDAAIAAPKSSRWEAGTNASRSLLYAATKPGGTTVQATGGVLAVQAAAESLLGVALERDLRRSIADIFNDEQSLITAGVAALMQGQLTFLCASLAQALGLDSVYRLPGLVVMTSADELDGLTHRAVGRARMTPERALPGKASKWLLVVDFREQAS